LVTNATPGVGATNPPADTDLAASQGMGTNSALLNLSGTNLTLSFTNTTNASEVGLASTNPLALTTVDTSSPGFTNLESIPPALKAALGAVRFDMQSFRIISDRNIFNPNRRPLRFGGTPPPRNYGDYRGRSESFSLIGTLSYEKGRFAFFEGSGAQYRQVLKPSDTIGGYKIAEVAPNHVKLEGTNGQAIELSVGSQMRKQDDGGWRLTDRYGLAESRSPSTESPETAPGTSSTSTAPGTSTERPASPSSSAESDILKKLMEKREQELNK
jgi:hypothetical protein